MSDYDIGYRKPPRHSRFKKGAASPNPKGRPKRRALEPAEIINRVLKAPAEYRENGRSKTAPRHELTLMTHVRRALNGDAASAETLLKLRTHAQRFSDTGVHKIRIDEWLPDYAGQTGEQKTSESITHDKDEIPGWWKHAGGDPPGEN